MNEHPHNIKEWEGHTPPDKNPWIFQFPIDEFSATHSGRLRPCKVVVTCDNGEEPVGATERKNILGFTER